jgi:energy-coupling factor transporter ATP-binding protein EcfA2
MNDETQTPTTVEEPVPNAIVARIAKIGLSDYRAFPRGQIYEFDLGETGKNLLLYGENGSGKTSLFRALRDLTSLRPGPVDFADLRHIFAPGEDGFISLQLTAGIPNEFRWDYGDEHPRVTAGQPYAALAERCRFLDYKAILETSFVHRSNAPNLFNLLVRVVLKDLPVIVGGKLERLGEVYDRMVASQPGPRAGSRQLESVDQACADFNTALINHLPEVVEEGNRLLVKLGYEGLTFNLIPKEVKYDRKKREFFDQEIALSVQLFGKTIEYPQFFLNEARLTALALAIYFGGAKLVLRSPSTGPDGTIMVRLLVLDDVLIGLDLANRLPVLTVLNDDFEEWQVLLFTYDRTWFDLAKGYTQHTGRWKHLALREMTTALGQPCFPNIEPCPDFLKTAEKHFRSGDLMAAAVYIRAGFEQRIKKICSKCSIRIPYKPDPKDVKADDLWTGIVDRQKERQREAQADFISSDLMKDVETVRSTILNRLSHSGTTNLVTKEVKFALEAVKKLQHYQFKEAKRFKNANPRYHRQPGTKAG